MAVPMAMPANKQKLGPFFFFFCIIACLESVNFILSGLWSMYQVKSGCLQSTHRDLRESSRESVSSTAVR